MEYISRYERDMGRDETDIDWISKGRDEMNQKREEPDMDKGEADTKWDRPDVQTDLTTY